MKKTWSNPELSTLDVEHTLTGTLPDLVEGFDFSDITVDPNDGPGPFGGTPAS